MDCLHTYQSLNIINGIKSQDFCKISTKMKDFPGLILNSRTFKDFPGPVGTLHIATKTKFVTNSDTCKKLRCLLTVVTEHTKGASCILEKSHNRKT